MSVREFAGWIEHSVRFEAERADPMLFPETAKTLELARKDKLRVLPITREYRASDDVREAGKERIYGAQAWKRADGQQKSKTCERSRVGLVVCGPGQGEAFLVCIDKERCATHWAAWQKERKKRQAGRSTGSVAKERERLAREQKQREQENARQEAERKRWEIALPAVLAAVADEVKKAPAKATGLLADIILGAIDDFSRGRGKLGALVARGSSAEDLVRHAAFIVLMAESAQWNAWNEFPKRARAFSVDVRKILDEQAPLEKVQTSGKTAEKK